MNVKGVEFKHRITAEHRKELNEKTVKDRKKVFVVLQDDKGGPVVKRLYILSYLLELFGNRHAEQRESLPDYLFSSAFLVHVSILLDLYTKCQIRRIQDFLERGLRTYAVQRPSRRRACGHDSE